MKSLAEVYQVTNADSLGCPTIESGPADAEWTAEIGSIAEDTTLKFGARELKPHQVAKEIKVSRKLLRSSVLPVESIVSEVMAQKFAGTMEKAFLSGSGLAQPLGLFTTSAAGITAGRNMATDNTATEISADNLLRTQAHVRPPYQPGCVWVAHPDFFLRVSLLKDGMSNYIWRPGLVAGSVDTLLGKPVYRSEYAPNTFTTGQLVAVYGNMKYYVIAETLSFGIQALNELYAKTSQIGYIGRAEVDGMPKFAEAFARVTMG
jgi:HK97 family phage major capsid protein